jgi:hypothetical protein
MDWVSGRIPVSVDNRTIVMVNAFDLAKIGSRSVDATSSMEIN